MLFLLLSQELKKQITKGFVCIADKIFDSRHSIFGVIQLILDSVTIWIWVKLGTDAKEVSDLYLVQPHYKLSTNAKKI